MFRNLSMLKIEEPKSMQRFVAMGCQVVCCRICRVFSLVLVLYVVDFFSSGFWLGDAYHITQPPSDGRGAILAMTRALRQVSFLYHHILICICYAALEVLCWLSCQLIMYACCDCFIYYLFSLSPIFYICYCHINVETYSDRNWYLIGRFREIVPFYSTAELWECILNAFGIYCLRIL